MNASTQDTAARRYRIERYLTEGGMGAIYLGKKLGSGGFEKEVVLKQLLPEYTARPEFRDLFFREARISATLDHANIVHTFDLVESDQSLFIVMEYVRGADLRTIVRRARHRHRELSPAAAVHVALGILAGLSYAHTRRDANGTSLDIIHRDVSPSNIICSAHGEAKLSDFGIARAATHSSVFYRVRGKVGYMSPEQARNESIDHRCDLFSLAVCLYESLSGERLFVGDLTTPADEIYGRAVPPLSHRRPGIPASLDAVVARALSPELEHRYASAAEFSDTLRTVAHHTGLTFSAPELAAHLRDILGDDVSRWLRDEPTSGSSADPQKVPAESIGLVGKEAASIGIVRETQEDEARLAVVNDGVVSGRKTFDIDSMLNDEATRPGGPAPRGETVVPESDEPSPSETTRRTVAPSAPSRLSHTPPAVWTRDSGPVRVAPSSADPKGTPLPTTPVSTAARTSTPVKLNLPPPPAPPFPKRPLVRGTQKSAAVPPPFSSALPPPTGVRAPLAIPLPPPLPPPHPPALSTEESTSQTHTPGEFEEATPFPGVQIAFDQPEQETGDTTLPRAPLNAHSPAIDADDELTRGLLPSPRAPLPSLRAPLPSLPSPGPLPPMSSRHLPLPAPSPEPPPLVGSPAPIDGIGSGSPALTVAMRGGPPRWFAIGALAVSAIAGAYLANRLTERDGDGALALGAAHADAPAAPASASGAATIDNQAGSEPNAPVPVANRAAPPPASPEPADRPPRVSAPDPAAVLEPAAVPAAGDTTSPQSARRGSTSSSSSSSSSSSAHRKHRSRH